MEKLTAFYSTVYNTCVEYYGERREVIDFLSKFDIWNGKGQKIENSNPRYRFEFSKDFYDYMKTEDFKHVMRKMNIKVEIS